MVVLVDMLVEESNTVEKSIWVWYANTYEATRLSTFVSRLEFQVAINIAGTQPSQTRPDITVIWYHVTRPRHMRNANSIKL